MHMIKKLACLLLCVALCPGIVYAKDDMQILEKLRSTKIIWNQPYPDKQLNHDNLKNSNPNYIGWLSFDFNVESPEYRIIIEEPVTFETEPDYYLQHDFYGNPDKNGCVFMDLDSDKSLYGYNDFLYAHHAENKTLFGTLNHVYEFGNNTYLKEHPQYMYIYTKTACHKYALIGYERVADSNNYYAYTTCENEQMYLEYIDYLKQLPDYIKNAEIQWDCKPPILNFSTCDDPPGTDKRLILHFAKIAAYAK